MKQCDVIAYVLSKPISFFFSCRSVSDIQRWQAPLLKSLKEKIEKIPFFSEANIPYTARDINKHGYQQIIYVTEAKETLQESVMLDNKDGDGLNITTGISSTGRAFLCLASQFVQFYTSAIDAYLRSKVSSLPIRHTKYSYTPLLRQEMGISWFSDFQWIYDKSLYSYPYLGRGPTMESYIPLNRREELLEMSFPMANDFSQPASFAPLDSAYIFAKISNKRGFLQATPNQLDYLISVEKKSFRSWTGHNVFPLLVLTGEVTHPAMWKKIKEFFGPKVAMLDYAPHTVVGARIWKCKNHWHLFPTCLAETNANNQLILTNLIGHRAVWYKYNTEDIIENLRWGICECGFVGQMFDKYIGENLNNFFVNGRCYTSHAMRNIVLGSLCPRFGIDQCRLMQNKDGTLTIEVVPYFSNDSMYKPLDMNGFKESCYAFFQTNQITVNTKLSLQILPGYKKIHPVTSEVPMDKLQGQIVNIKTD